MMQVWFLFKSMEAFLGTVCVAYHCMGFQGKEPLPHILIYCGTFFGFTIMSLTGAIALGVGAAPPALTECIVNFVAAFLYIVASIMSMHNAESDFHLMYLSDFEEPRHPFFSFCRAQSICALSAGALHLLHAVLAFDVIVTPRNAMDDSSDDSDSDSGSELNTMERRPIRMYFLSKVVETKLRKFNWFDHLCRRRSPNVSIFSILRGRSKHGSSKSSKYSVGGESGKMTTSKSFFRHKPKKQLKKPEKIVTTNIDDSPDEEEESLSRVTYSDFTEPKHLSHTTLVRENEKPTKLKASTNDDNPTRVSFTGSADSKRPPPAPRFNLPNVADLSSPPSHASQRTSQPTDQSTLSNDALFKGPATATTAPAPEIKSTSLTSIMSQETGKKRLSVASESSSKSPRRSGFGKFKKDPLPEQKASFSLTTEQPSRSASLASNTPRSILKSSSTASESSDLKFPKLPAEETIPDTPMGHVQPVSSTERPLAPSATDIKPEAKKSDTLAEPRSLQKVEVGTSVPSLGYSEEDQLSPALSGQKSRYSTPTASAGSIFERYKAENEASPTSADEGAAPKKSKDKDKEQEPPPPPPPPPPSPSES